MKLAGIYKWVPSIWHRFRSITQKLLKISQPKLLHIFDIKIIQFSITFVLTWKEIHAHLGHF